MCSRSTDSFSISIAFSTGMTCMPIPAPPSGTNGVIFSSGRRDICSKKCSHLRVGFQNFCVHIKKFCTSRYIHRQDILLLMLRHFPSCIREDLCVTFLPEAPHIFSLPDRKVSRSPAVFLAFSPQVSVPVLLPHR